jgi:hypothetical protein
MSLHEKLVEIRKLVKALKKDAVGKTGFKDYPYISTDNILSAIMEKMNELKVLLIPTLSDCTLKEFNYTNSSGKDKTDFITQGVMGFTWVNAEEPADREYVPWYFFGQQDEASKSLGSGLTYSQRYFLKMSFQIATDEDDPDNNDTSDKVGQQKPQSQPQKQQKPPDTPQDDTKATKAQIAEIFKLYKEKDPDGNVFEWIDRMAADMKISNKYPYADKLKTIINWTVDDYTALIDDLERLF